MIFKVSLKSTDGILNRDDWENHKFGDLIGTINNSSIECEEPNNRLSKFQGTYSFKDEKIQISNDNVLLRGTILRNCESVLALVVYAGSESKLMKNGGESRFKRTHMDLMMNNVVLIIFAALLVTAAAATGCHVYFEFDVGQSFRMYLPWSGEGPGAWVTDRKWL